MLVVLLACASPAVVIDACVDDPSLCTPCEADADCAYTGNPCTETVYCASTDAAIAVIEIGCSAATERPWPAPETCACDAGTCRSGP